MMLTNNDVVSQNIGNTVARLAYMNIAPGAGTTEVHIWALQQMAREIESCWELLKELNKE